MLCWAGPPAMPPSSWPVATICEARGADGGQPDAAALAGDDACEDDGRAFHVAPGGSDDGAGDCRHPFATLARARRAMATSMVTTTILAGGTYHLSATVTLAAADSGARILGAPGSRPVLDGGGALAQLMTLDGASHVVLAGLGFANTARDGVALTLAGGNANRVTGNDFEATGTAIMLAGSSDNVVRGNDIRSSGKSGIEAKDGSDDNLFADNLIDGVRGLETAGGGFFLHGVAGNRITHNLVTNTAGMGIGLENWSDTTVNTGNVIDHNQVIATNAQSTDSGSIYLLGRSRIDTKSIVSDNYIDGTGRPEEHGVGIYLDDLTSGVLVSNNIVRGIGSDAVEIHGGRDVIVRNNVFDLGAGHASAVLFQAAPKDQVGKDQVAGAQGGDQAHKPSPPPAMTGIVVERNIIYSQSVSPKIYYYIDGGSPKISGNLYYNVTGAAMTTRAPMADVAPRFGDPLFADPARGDYTLLAGSAAALIDFAAFDQFSSGRGCFNDPAK